MIDRRKLVLGLAAASPLVLPRFVAKAAGSDDPFPLGVASGEPLPDGFVIWTRLAPVPLAEDGHGGLAGPVAVRWEVGADEAMGTIVACGKAQADARLAHSVHVEVEGLKPGRPYWYRFTALGAQSPVGKAATAPARGARPERMRLAAASCAHYEVGWYAAYRHMAEERPDLVLFLGDYIYDYSYGRDRADLVRRHATPGEASTLAAYRGRYAQYKQDPDLKALHLVAPCLVTWDDHEVQNDYAGRWSQNVSMTEEAFLARRAAAYQAFYEHMPVRRRALPSGPSARLYARFDFGDLARINVLDERQYRSRQPCATPGSRRGHVAPESCPDLLDPGRTMLGAPQERWLAEGLSTSGSRWNILAQQLLFSPYLQKTTGGELGNYTDGWGGYGAARARLIADLDKYRVRNPVFLGGDLHAFVAADVKDERGRTIAAEFVGTSITSDPAPDVLRATLQQNPHVHRLENAYRGHLSLDLRRDHMEARLQAISDRRDPRATASTLACFVVEDRRSGLIF